MERREFLRVGFGAAAGMVFSGSVFGAKNHGAKGKKDAKTSTPNETKSVKDMPKVKADKNMPNIILCLADDQGWGDTGYNGHPRLKTPNLDVMSKSGIRFDRWYAGAPVCSPTRGSCLTGRHPYRYGIFNANVGHMKKEEITIAEALKTKGYATGHFGKWHLGTLTKDIKDGRRGGKKGAEDYSPPWENGFDECFSTEQAVPTWDPMINQSFKTKYWIGEGKFESENLEGDDSRVIMDRVIPFIDKNAKAETPFLAVVWFHACHEPVRAGQKYKDMYSDCTGNQQEFYGCITAMDEQVGRLRAELKSLGIEENTMLWYAADNGPEGTNGKEGRNQGETGGFRGRKRSLYEGGVREPGMLIWPAVIKEPRVVTMACSTLDYFPTILDFLGFKIPNQVEPIDGVSLKPLIEGKMTERPMPIGFQHAKQRSLTDNQYKLISADGGKTYELYDLINDKYETKDISTAHKDIAESMKIKLDAFVKSCEKSNSGKDYDSLGED
jgi:arylsulfatase A-like enzyme